MVAIHILSSQLVRPAATSSTEPQTAAKTRVIESCNLDLVILNVYIKTVYFYAPMSSPDPDFFCPGLLARSLSQALATFYPMAGRLARGGARSIDIVCNDAGALLVYARADCSLQELGPLKPKPEFVSLVPSLDAFPDEASQPLFIVQVTRFACGGVALGIGVEHHVADGLSAISFINAWGALARGELVEVSPSFDKEWLKARTPPMPMFPHYEYISLPPKPAQSSPRPLPSIQVFEFSKNFIQELKKKNLSPNSKPFTTYELLAAHIWRCVCEARNLASNEKTMLVTLVDGRSRIINPSSPDNFFGNVIFTSCPSEYVEKVVDCTLGQTSSIIRQALHGVDDTYCRSAIDFLEVEQDPSKFIKGAHTFASPNLGLISWCQLPIYDTDFGWGKPYYVGPAFMPWEGHAYLLKSPSTVGAFRLFISLASDHMPRFGELILKPS
ncbi:hypothetical protein GOP47_0027191 [Adiantum capillus-veneris]|nr:hypothetical protein GOP47_0027191 [Adiantum capillus-veneris]